MTHPQSDKRVCLAFINGISAFVALWRGIRGDRVIVFESEPLLPFTRRLSQWMLGLLIRSGFAEDWRKNLSANEAQIAPNYVVKHPDMFRRLEPEMERRFRFSRLHEKCPEDFLMAYKHAVAAYTDNSLREVSLLRLFETAGAEGNTRVIGVHKETLDSYQTYFGHPTRARASLIVRPSMLQNIGLTLMVGLITVLWCFSRLRFFPAKPEPVPLGADFINDPRYFTLLREVLATPKDALLIFRNKSMQTAAQGWKPCDGFRGYHKGSGILYVRQLPALLTEMFVDLVRLYRLGAAYPGALCYALIKIPYYRIMYRALTSRFKFRAFFGRDDYNTEHTIRTLEMRRAGVLSVGINHGLPVPETVSGVWRYLDFDLYYVFGERLYRKYYKSTWSSKMKVKAVGSFGMPPDQLALLDRPRPKDIIIFLSAASELEVFLDWIGPIARRFSDRKVYLKYRKNSIDIIDNLPANVIHVTTPGYELMLKASYALSTPCTTVAAEAIQYGLTTFIWDARDQLVDSYYREFRDLCISSPEAFINRIEAIENQSWKYPRDEYQGLVDLSGKSVFETIRADLR